MTGSGLNVVDIVIIVIFLISIILGMARGLVSEILSILVLVASFVVAIMFTDSLAAYFAGTSSVHSILTQASGTTGTDTSQPASYMIYGVSFLLLFLGTLIAGSIIKFVLNLMLSSSILGGGNRLLGAVFGVFRGYLVNLLLIFVVQLSPVSKEAYWQQSQIVPYFHTQVAWLASHVSPMLEKFSITLDTKPASQ